MAGDDEDSGAASVTEGAAAAVVLGVGEEGGEVRHGLGVRMAASGCVGGVRTGRGKDGGLRCSGGSGVDGAASPTEPRGGKGVKRVRFGAGSPLTKKGRPWWLTGDGRDDRVERLRGDANGDSGGYGRRREKRDGEVD